MLMKVAIASAMAGLSMTVLSGCVSHHSPTVHAKGCALTDGAPTLTHPVAYPREFSAGLAPTGDCLQSVAFDHSRNCPEMGSRFCAPNWRNVKDGMDFDEVVRMLGEPDHIEPRFLHYDGGTEHSGWVRFDLNGGVFYTTDQPLLLSRRESETEEPYTVFQGQREARGYPNGIQIAAHLIIVWTFEALVASLIYKT